MTEIMLDKQETLNEIGTKIRKLRESKNLSKNSQINLKWSTTTLFE